MLKLKLQYFGHLTWRTDSFEKTLMMEKIEGRKRRGWQRMRWLDGISDSVDMSETPGVGDGQGGLVRCSPWGRKESDTTEQLNWTELWVFNQLVNVEYRLNIFFTLLLNGNILLILRMFTHMTGHLKQRCLLW